MTRYAEIERAAIDVANDLEAELNAKYPASVREFPCMQKDFDGDMQSVIALRAALALPEDSKTVNAELYKLAIALADSAARSDIECVCATAPGGGYWIRNNDADVDRAVRYLAMREASGEPIPYRVVRDGDKVRFL